MHGQVAVNRNDLSGAHCLGEIGGDLLTLGTATNLGQRGLVKSLEFIRSIGQIAALLVVVRKEGTCPRLVGILTLGQEFFVSSGVRIRNILNHPQHLQVAPNARGRRVDHDTHLEEQTREDEHEGHEVHHHALRTNHGVVWILVLRHVLRHRQPDGQELRCNHNNDENDEDQSRQRHELRVANGVRQRDTEDLGGINFAGDRLSDRTQ